MSAAPKKSPAPEKCDRCGKHTPVRHVLVEDSDRWCTCKPRKVKK